MSKAVDTSTTSKKARDNQPAAPSNVIAFQRKVTPRIVTSARQSDRAQQLKLLGLMDEVIACLDARGGITA